MSESFADDLERPKSHVAFARAKELIPGGVNSPARAFGAVGGEPLFISHGEGPFLFDIDGRKHLDLIGSWGPLILGHCHPKVTSAVIEALMQGSSFGAPTERETELAALIMSAMPSIEMVRFVSSGTEAAMSAVRLARGFTGRDVIVKFAGCYHGHVDSLLVSAGSSALTHGVPSSPGVPAGCTADTRVLPFNGVQQLRDLFVKEGETIAAVLIEPVAGNMGLVVPTSDFMSELRSLTAKHGALLIFDEVMTGFRLAWGGAQSLLNIQPDLTILGKIVGGGLPVGAFGGRKDVMEKLMPLGPVFQAGTLSGNPLAMAAGIATLSELNANPPYEHLERLGARIEEGLHFACEGLPHQVNRVGSMFTLFFTGRPVVDLDSATTSDVKRFGKFFWHMMNLGVYLPCSQFEAAFLSAPMTVHHIEAILVAAQVSMELIALDGQ